MLGRPPTTWALLQNPRPVLTFQPTALLQHPKAEPTPTLVAAAGGICYLKAELETSLRDVG